MKKKKKDTQKLIIFVFIFHQFFYILEEKSNSLVTLDTKIFAELLVTNRSLNSHQMVVAIKRELRSR